MLSTNQPSSIQRRRAYHRRQNSTPAAFEAPQVRPTPANRQQKRQQRSGMSLDLRGLDLDAIRMPQRQPLSDQMNPTQSDSFPQEDSTVSITNIGQPQQHFMQVAQTHSQTQPGSQESFMQSPVQQSLSSPRTPHRTLCAQSPTLAALSPSKTPSEQELKDLHEHIRSVYGSEGQVFINILPSASTSPQKQVQLPSHESFESAPMPLNLVGMADINLEPTSSAMTFDFDNPDIDMGYESSSYYTSDALSPSPLSSPLQRSVQPFLEGIEEHPAQELAFSQAPALLPGMSSTDFMTGIPLPTDSPTRLPFLPDLPFGASIEETGISAEEVQRYISEQDPASNKWTCLYPDCGKVFGRRENIRSHVQTHLGDRQYRCNECGKCFVRQHDLKRHAKIHTGNKPHTCKCGAGFARQDALTRHRQRGMCVGGFKDAVRRQAKRGRPKKHRPDIQERVNKANRTRRALISAASSVSAGSPSEPHSTTHSPSPLEDLEYIEESSLPRLLPDMGSFGDSISTSVDPFSFDTASNSYAEDADIKIESYPSSVSFSSHLNVLQQMSQPTNTPPMSPADKQSISSGSSIDRESQVPAASQTGPCSPSPSSLKSNPFSTPPTSPVEPKSEVNDLFEFSMPDISLPDTSCTEFDLAMKSLGEMNSMDSSVYDLLDFDGSA